MVQINTRNKFGIYEWANLGITFGLCSFLFPCFAKCNWKLHLIHGTTFPQGLASGILKITTPLMNIVGVKIFTILSLQRYEDTSNLLMEALQSQTNYLKQLERKVNDLEAHPRWPTGSYCILKKGKCPIGFTHVENGVHALKMWSCTGGFSGKGNVGDSIIGKHKNCQNGNYGDVVIHACCK